LHAELRRTDASGLEYAQRHSSHFFERFRRGWNVSDDPGNGLGLANVKAIVGAYGGDVAVQSEPMKGTKISVTVPIALH